MSDMHRIQRRIADLVASPSVSSTAPAHDQGNRGVIDQLAEWLHPLGFDCRVMAVPGRDGKFNLVATRGEGDGGLVLSGHSDTVPYDADAWQSDPFTLTERDGAWYGLGACDMKGFLALAVEVAAEYADTALSRPLTILATADEESSMSGARELARAGRVPGEAAVIGEPTGLRPIRMNKGILMEAIHVHGHAGHSSNPALGVNAIEGMQQVLAALGEFRDTLRTRMQATEFRVNHGTLNFGRIEGGDSPNRIPAQCTLDVDLRFIPGFDLAALREELRTRVRDAIGNSDCTVTFDALIEGTPAFETAADATLVQTLERLTGERVGAVDFGTEGAFLQQMGLETVIWGPGHIEHAHQPDEHLPMAHIEPAMSALRGLVDHYCR